MEAEAAVEVMEAEATVVGVAVVAAAAAIIATEEVGEWWRVADSVVWGAAAAQAASAQIGCQCLLVFDYRTWYK